MNECDDGVSEYNMCETEHWNKQTKQENEQMIESLDNCTGFEREHGSNASTCDRVDQRVWRGEGKEVRRESGQSSTPTTQARGHSIWGGKGKEVRLESGQSSTPTSQARGHSTRPPAEHETGPSTGQRSALSSQAETLGNKRPAGQGSMLNQGDDSATLVTRGQLLWAQSAGSATQGSKANQQVNKLSDIKYKV